MRTISHVLSYRPNDRFTIVEIRFSD